MQRIPGAGGSAAKFCVAESDLDFLSGFGSIRPGFEEDSGVVLRDEIAAGKKKKQEK